MTLNNNPTHISLTSPYSPCQPTESNRADLKHASSATIASIQLQTITKHLSIRSTSQFPIVLLLHQILPRLVNASTDRPSLLEFVVSWLLTRRSAKISRHLTREQVCIVDHQGNIREKIKLSVCFMLRPHEKFACNSWIDYELCSSTEWITLQGRYSVLGFLASFGVNTIT